MQPHTHPILSYAPPPKRRSLRAIARRLLKPILTCALLALFTYGIYHGPTSAQIRLDSGDIRYRWFGIPLYYQSMPEPYRSKILALKSPTVSPRWVSFDEYPMGNWHDHTHRFQYREVAARADADPNIARWALEDLADYMEHAKWGLPKSSPVLNPFVVDVMTDALRPNWRDLDDVKSYCTSHSYTPPPPPAPKP